MKKIIVIYGAFDRYNYGDNMMPIIFELFINKYHPDFKNKYTISFASLTKSDLSKYKAIKTVAIKTLINKENIKKIHAIIVIGGEVVGASTSALFTHFKHIPPLNFLVKKYKVIPIKQIKNFPDLIFNKHYGIKWFMPYLPYVKDNNEIKIIFNTVGGNYNKLNNSVKSKVKNSLQDATYISARDIRTSESLKTIRDVKVYPDSVSLISDLINNSMLDENTSDCFRRNFNQDYIIFQGTENKVGVNIDEVCKFLSKLNEITKLPIILLPIGYAEGHGDYNFLRKVNKKLKDSFRIIYPLNIWEITYLIKNAKVFIGTSLHGCITAMSFEKPYFGVNPRNIKVDNYLRCWGSPPFNKSYELGAIIDVINYLDIHAAKSLEKNAFKMKDLSFINMNNILNALNAT